MHSGNLAVTSPAEEGPTLDGPGAFVLDALMAALEIACDAAVFSNRFEVDEQEPLSRIKALTEQLVEGVNSLPNKGLSQDEEAIGKTAIVTMIGAVCERIHATIVPS